nr:ubiquitin carboxyl terminal hydrolase 8 [Hymenolepis microstoma]
MKWIAELEQKCFCDLKSKSSDEIEKLIPRLFDMGKENSKTNMEKAFIYYGRGLNMYNALKSRNYDKISQQLISNCVNAERAYCQLRIELCVRFLENLEICDDPLPSHSEKQQKPVHFPGRWMPPEYFYERLKTGDAFLVDVRSSEDYSRKRIVEIPQINVGGGIVSGLTITSLENRLDTAQFSEWNIHKSAQVIVLMDEDTGRELIANPDGAETFQLPSRCPLKIVYDALVTYNAEKTSMPSTLFLSGGLEEFEKRYPTLVVMSSSYQSTSKSDLLSGITYGSIVDDTSEQVPDRPSPINTSIDLDAGDELHRRHRANEDSSSVKSFKPVIDRSTKPQPPFQPFEPPEPKEEKPKVPEVNRSVKPQITTQNGDKNLTAYVRPGRLKLNQVPPIALVRGLVNMGNTCYMNSSLQCLLHTPVLWNYFIQPEDAILGNQLVAQFVAFVRAMSNRGECATAFSPGELKSCFESAHPMFAGGRQQDSQEFLIILLDSLHEALKSKSLKVPPINKKENPSVSDLSVQSWNMNRARDDSVILDWFNGQLRSKVQCLKCARPSNTFDEFMYLSVPVQENGSSDLMHCMKQFFKPERLLGSSQWLCPQCKVPREAQKTFEIWRFPDYLIIHLKRFYCSGACQKIENMVTFPLKDLDLSQFMKNPEQTNSRYDLYAVINHYGRVDSGHYTAFCFDSVCKKWFNFDDAHVAELPTSRIQTSAAYVLFYRLSASA